MNLRNESFLQVVANSASFRSQGTAGFGSYAVVAPDVTTFTDGNIMPRGKYTYRVKALGQDRDSQYSNLVTLTLRK